MNKAILSLLDFDQVDALLEGFNKSTGFVTAIIDLEGNVLSKSGWRQMCTRFHRIHPETSKKCTISDTELANKMAEGEKYHFYKCLNGLVDVAVPIVIDGVHIANLFSGQFFFEEPDISYFKKQAEKYCFDENEYLEALSKVPVVSEERVKTVMDFLLNMTRMISEITFQKEKQVELNKQIIAAKEKSEESEKKYRLLTEFAADVVWVLNLTAGKFDYISPSIFQLRGFTVEEAMNETLEDVMTPEALTIVKDAITKNTKYFLEHPEATNYYINEIQQTCKNGQVIWVEISTKFRYSPTGDIEVVGVSRNIDERKRAEEALKLLNRAVEASSVAIEITDAEGNIIYVNPYFTELTGYSHEEALGKNPRFLKSGNHPKTFYEELWNTILSGRDWTGEFQNRKKNGALYWENAVISPILNSNGKVTNFVAIKEDVTERKKILRELIASKHKAEESDRLKSAFLANMSHEIRTPMNGILGFSDLLKNPNLAGEAQQKYISIIEKSGKRMLNIINDIIDISKIEAGLMKLDMNESNINEMIEYAYTFFKPEAETKKIKLAYKTPLPLKEATINTDREKMYAVLTNLVKNAIKFTEKGEIELGYNIVETHGLASLKFYVKDTGIGIPKERQEAIFERFIQADIQDKMAIQGAGLGLAISKAYVEMLGGVIQVESEEGKGSIFYFTLPCNTELENETIDRQPEPTEKNETVRKLKILIAEDDEVSELLIDINAKMFGKEILKARTGVEAIKVCRANPDIDLILMDIRMPEMSGYEATKQIRLFNQEVIIIAQTAYGLSGDREKSIDAGCNDYISKPIEKVKLLTLIQKHFGK